MELCVTIWGADGVWLVAFVLAIKPSFERTSRTSFLLTGLVRTALNRVPSSVMRNWSCAA